MAGKRKGGDKSRAWGSSERVEVTFDRDFALRRKREADSLRFPFALSEDESIFRSRFASLSFARSLVHEVALDTPLIPIRARLPPIEREMH